MEWNKSVYIFSFFHLYTDCVEFVTLNSVLIFIKDSRMIASVSVRILNRFFHCPIKDVSLYPRLEQPRCESEVYTFWL